MHADRINTAFIDILIGMMAIVSPESPILGSITWHLRIGWSRIITSRCVLNVICTLAGRSDGERVPCWGEIENSSQISAGHSGVGSNENLRGLKNGIDFTKQLTMTMHSQATLNFDELKVDPETIRQQSIETVLIASETVFRRPLNNTKDQTI